MANSLSLTANFDTVQSGTNCGKAEEAAGKTVPMEFPRAHSKLKRIIKLHDWFKSLRGGFFLLVELHRDGSARSLGIRVCL